MSNKYQNLGAFLHSLSESNTVLAPLLIYINRKGVYDKFQKAASSSATFLIPSDKMMEELNGYFKHGDFLKLDSAVLSLLIKQKVSSPKDWANGVRTENGNSLFPEKFSHKSLHFNNSTAQLVNKGTGSVVFWQLSGSHIPKTVRRQQKCQKIQVKPKKKKRGGFEHEDINVEDFEKMIQICQSKIKKSGGFKQLVCELYYCLSEEDKKIANCFINGNPYAEFFLLIDSPFVKVDMAAFAAKTCDGTYEEIMNIKGDYLCCNGDSKKLEELRDIITDSTFMDNNYKKFYENIAANNGEFIEGAFSVSFCHPALPQHLYSIEMLCFCMAKLGQKYENSADKDSVLEEMININLLTNTKSTQHVIFEDAENPVVNFEEFKKRFESFGLCLCKTIKEGQGERKVKLKDRKKMKLRRKISKLTLEEKKKLLN